MKRTTMAGERIPATRTLGGVNSRHQYGYNSGGPSWACGVLGERRERHNRAVKKKANGQRRTQDRTAIAQSQADWEGDLVEVAVSPLATIASRYDDCCSMCGGWLDQNGRCPNA